MTLRITRQGLLDGTIRARRRAYVPVNGDTGHRTEAEMAELLEKILAAHDETRDLWVFGYGSLIWNPAFEFEQRKPALLHGWHRRFCLKTYTGRGTAEAPGLILALDHGGACKGVAFRIAAGAVRAELGVLWQREMYGGAYHARWVNLQAGGETFRAVTFVINRLHPRYVKELSVAQAAVLIATGCGDLGTCREYLENTVSHLDELGLRDAGLARIVEALPKP
jgi:glutathione-specific gamma-glutamylcyclotransferase